MRVLAALASLALLVAPLTLRAEPVPAAVSVDPPQDKAHPAQMIAFALPTHGVKINAVLYTAAGAGPHPTVLLLRGLPGNEQNLDLAQAIRRDGWNVLTLHYRGSWGSPERFSFTHCIEDAEAALVWLRDPYTAQAAYIDRAKIVVIGHSMGGFVTAYTAGHDPLVMGAALISAANLGTVLGTLPHKILAKVIDDNIGVSAGMHTLAGTSIDALADEAQKNAAAWDFNAYAPVLAKHPLLLVTSNDGLASASDKLAETIGKIDGAQVSQVRLPPDHSYSDQRIGLETTVLRWLENLPGAPAGP